MCFFSLAQQAREAGAVDVPPCFFSPSHPLSDFRHLFFARLSSVNSQSLGSNSENLLSSSPILSPPMVLCILVHHTLFSLDLLLCASLLNSTFLCNKLLNNCVLPLLCIFLTTFFYCDLFRERGLSAFSSSLSRLEGVEQAFYLLLLPPPLLS